MPLSHACTFYMYHKSRQTPSLISLGWASKIDASPSCRYSEYPNAPQRVIHARIGGFYSLMPHNPQPPLISYQLVDKGVSKSATRINTQLLLLQQCPCPLPCFVADSDFLIPVEKYG